MYMHQDTLAMLNASGSVGDKLRVIHELLGEQVSIVERISVALYDARTGNLRTYADSSSAVGAVLHHYQAQLDAVPSLKEVVNQGRPRVIRDMSIYGASSTRHSRNLLKEGYHTSYTLPMYQNGNFQGFVFFNAKRGKFSANALRHMDIFGHLISLVVLAEHSAIQTLLAAVKTARDVTHHRDVETGAHLDRMAHYSRLIARKLADRYDFNDEYIEHLFLFAPLHDIGKIAVADSILLKPSQLTDAEFEAMKQHVSKGHEIVDEMLDNFGLDSIQRIDMLRNIVLYHHEAVDGTGYPHGLVGEDIPIEARIISVADVFDALTSRRPYKEAWDNDRAFARLSEISGKQLDKNVVDALCAQRDEIEHIQSIFKEGVYCQ